MKKEKEGLDLTPKKAVKLQAYQAYLSLYKDTVMPAIQQKFEAYKASVPPEEVRAWWGFVIDQAKEMLAAETEEIKAQVEDFRDKNMQIEYGVESFCDDGETAPAGDLCDRARNIQRYAQTSSACQYS